MGSKEAKRCPRAGTTLHLFHALRLSLTRDALRASLLRLCPCLRPLAAALRRRVGPSPQPPPHHSADHGRYRRVDGLGSGTTGERNAAIAGINTT